MGSGEGFGQGRQATAVALRSLSVALGCGTGATGAGLAVPVLRWHASVPGVTDLTTMYPDLAAQAHGWDPSVVLATNWKKVRWTCVLGHEWSAAIGDRVRGNECPTCKRRVVLAGQVRDHPSCTAQVLRAPRALLCARRWHLFLVEARS